MKRNNLLLSVLSVVVLGGALVGCNDTPPVIMKLPPKVAQNMIIM